MDLAEYLRVLRAHKVLIAACVVTFTLVAGVLAWTRTPIYHSHAQLFVSTKTANPDDIYTGGLFSQQRIQSYARLVTSPSVLRGVISELDLPESEAALASRIRVVVPEDTVLIDVTVSNESPNRARSIAEALGRSFAQFVSTLESSRGEASPVKVTITGPPQLPTAPASPKKKVYLLLGALAGFLIGVVGAVIREAHARSRRLAPTAVALPSIPRALPPGQAFDAPEHEIFEPPLRGVADEVAQIVRAPVLATVSESNGRVDVEGQLGSPHTPVYDGLQQNLLATARTSGLRSFVLTSAVGAVGKTAISAHIASSFADAGYRVILVDANFENPTLTQSLGLSESTGLAEVMEEHVSLDSALHSWRNGSQNSNLSLLTTGRPRTDPVDLLRPGDMNALLRALKTRADIVFIDGPSILSGYGATELSGSDSGSILVARTSSLRASDLEAATESLRSANASIVGVIVNTAERL